MIAAAAGWAAGATAPKADNSPHADALALVLRTQMDEIRKAEDPKRLNGTGDELWWHDTDPRTWVVVRPIGPGVFDTTHSFDVTYRIGKKDVAKWSVDTRKGTATRIDAGAKK